MMASIFRLNSSAGSPILSGRTSAKSAKTARSRQKWREALKMLFCVVIAGSLMLGAARAQIKYSLIELAGLKSPQTFPAAINNGGEVVGTYWWNDLSTHSFIYRGGALHDLGTLNGYENIVTAINNYGQVVGYFRKFSNANGPSELGYSRASNGIITLLGGLFPENTEPMSINDGGVIVGSSGNYAFIYQNSQMSALEAFQGQVPFLVASINNRGQMVAWYRSAAQTRSVLYSAAQMQDISSPSSSRGTFGYCLNNHGLILGSYMASSGGTDNFTYGSGKFQDLGGKRTFNAINNSGRIVGYKSFTAFTDVAILSDGVQDQDLNTLIDPNAAVNLSTATGINDSGQICASGTNAAGVEVGFLLTPIR